MSTVKYEIVPVDRFLIRRTSAGDEVTLIEDVAMTTSILEARRFLRAVTEYDRKHPEDKATTVLDYGDTEIH